jgi:hypothetical protein
MSDEKQIQIVQTSEPKPETFRGKSVGQIVAKAVEDTVADTTLLSDGISDRVRASLKSRLASYLEARLATLDETAIKEIEEEVRELRVENDQLKDTGYASLKNDRRYKEQLICLLLYIYNDGEKLELQKDRIENMSDVEFAFEEDEDYITIFPIEESEE